MSAGRRIAVPDDVDWRRMHPISPLLEGWKVVTAVVAVLTVRNVDNLVEAYRYATAHGLDLTRGVVRWAVAGTLLAGAAVVAVLFAQWWVTTYAVDRDGVYLRRGILVKRLRVARSPRIQSVDIVHPLLGRVFGLGQLTVEVAGGSDSRVVIGYLGTDRLEELRDRILDLAAGAGGADGAAGAGGADGDRSDGAHEADGDEPGRDGPEG
ncbi:PH domain-containing protein, partial [Actinomyces israelii]|uniref:PH domain-containing protein n=1 Tax=Actinomyces israelii TaxID=1659 RepID=UPI0023544C81